jgi:hypothetical protein
MVQLSDESNTEFNELYRRSFLMVGSASGTNAYTGSIPLSRALEEPNGFYMVVPNGNTGPCTFNGKPLVTSSGAALQAGQLSTGLVIAFVYLQTPDHYRIITPLAAGLAPIVRVYTSATATWTRPAGLVALLVKQQAPGGGGGIFTSGGSLFTGGSSGSYGERLFAASLLPATVTITNGAPGVGGFGGTGIPATAGANSSFGSLLTTNGGGAGGSNTTIAAPGGAAGTGGDINRAGLRASGPAGANSPSPGGWGGQGVTPGQNGTLGGGGGGGGGIFTSGGNGGPGETSVTEYYA